MIFRSFSENSSHRARVFSWEHPIPTANTDGLGRFGNTKGRLDQGPSDAGLGSVVALGVRCPNSSKEKAALRSGRGHLIGVWARWHLWLSSNCSKLAMAYMPMTYIVMACITMVCISHGPHT